jgi:hypothetical protein
MAHIVRQRVALRYTDSMKSAFGAVFAWGLLLASCSFFETTVTRDVRAVWSPEGASLLLVGSQYTTAHPEEPYFAGSGRNWQVVLETADPAVDDPLAARTPLEIFPELINGAPVAQGGQAQNNPVSWYPALKRVVFAGPQSYVRDVQARTSWEVPLPPAQPLTELLATALGSVNEVEARLTPARVASEMGLLDCVPSPDGTILAALYGVFYLYGDALSQAYLYPVVVFWDVSTRTASGATRVTTDVWQDLRSLEPYRELFGEANNYSMMAWKPDGSGVWVYLSSTDDETGTTHAKQVVSVSRTGAATPATQVPQRPLPTASGPVSSTGVAFVLTEVQPNVTALERKVLAGWKPFDTQPLVDVVTLGPTSSDYWGFF